MLALAAQAGSSSAQDIVEIARESGAPVPLWVQQALARDPGAFQVRHGWKPALERAKARRSALMQTGFDVQALTVQAAATYGTTVAGQYKVPVLAVRYENTKEEPYPAADLQAKLFGTSTTPLTLTTFYTEISRNAVEVTGTVHAWAPLLYKDEFYEAGDNGAPPYLGALLREAVEYFDDVVDFSQYDSDGDGIVDAVAFVHPETGGECGTDNIWSHRWTYEAASGGQRLITKDGVEIVDYSIQPALNCDGESMISIGVFAHETGHLWGLPDLYSSNNSNAGIDVWGLMGSGNWNTPDSPAHMSAWSKVELGWMPVRTLSADTAHVVLDQIETAGSIIRVNVPGTSEYFLLENRQRIGSDSYLMGTGLLVWHVDSAVIANNLWGNSVQNVTARKGIDLVEADGSRALDDPAGSASAGHTFPGSTGNYYFGTFSSPSSLSNSALPTGITLENIVESAGNITFNLKLEQSDCSPRIAVIGQTMNGTLATTDCAVEQRFLDAWVLNVLSTVELKIDLTSTAFDAFLLLTDASGNPLQAADDGAGGTDARIHRTLTAGQYVIWASTLTAGATGAYALILEQTGSAPCSMAPIALGETVTGTLATSDCMLNNHFYDRHELALAAATDVRLDLASVQFDAYLILTDAEGNTIAEDDDGGGNGDARIERSLAAGTYNVWISSYAPAEVGFYALQATDMNASTCSNGDIALGQTVQGVLRHTDCNLEGKYFDRHNLHLATDTTVLIDLRSNQFDAFLMVTDSVPNVLGEDDDGGDGTNSFLEIRLSAGWNVIWVSTYGAGELGEYTLHVAPVSACSVSTVAIGQTTTGSLAATDCANDGHYYDAWQLTVPADSLVTIDLSSSTFDSYLVLADGSGNVLHTDDDGGGATNSRIQQELPAGQYTVWVTSYSAGATGSYSLAVSAGTAAQCSTTGLSVGQSLEESLTTADCLVDRRYYDAYIVDLSAETTVRASVFSGAFDTYMILADANGNTVEVNDDASGTNSQIERTLAAGRHIIWITSYGEGELGEYTITLEDASGGGCTAEAMTFPDTISSTLETGDCAGGGHNYDPWLMTLSTQTAVRFDITSNEFDTYLFVADRQGNLIDEDDDSGEGTNSQLTLNLAAGEYFVWVSSAYPGETGAYVLTAVSAGSSGVSCYRRGDANGDGAVDRSDGELVLSRIAKTARLSEDEVARMDLTGDGIVDLFDAQAIADYLAGRVNPVHRVGLGICKAGEKR